MPSLIETRRRIADGTRTPAAAVDAVRAAIAGADPELGAFAALDPDPVVPERGPLAGIAVGVKDIVDTSRLPTQMGSVIWEGWRPKADAAIVARLLALGAVPLAKTVTTPFAGLDPAGTRNPRAPGRTPGGSSSGSAAAVAAGLLPLALGTQTGGSVIRPAAFCGVAAVKPSFRLLPMVGVKTFSWALDTLGLFAGDIADAAHALALLAGRPEIDLPATEPGAPSVGLVLQEFAGPPEPAGLAALHAAVRALERAGASVRELALPEALAAAWAYHPTVQDYEACQALAWEHAECRADLPPVLGAQLDRAAELTARDYDAARRSAHQARRALKDVFRGTDVLLTLSAPGPAPEGLGSTGDARFNRLWTLMGVPCVNVPVPGDGPPVGVQVIARFGDDGRALAAARLIEKALG